MKKTCANGNDIDSFDFSVEYFFLKLNSHKSKIYSNTPIRTIKSTTLAITQSVEILFSHSSLKMPTEQRVSINTIFIMVRL